MGSLVGVVVGAELGSVVGIDVGTVVGVFDGAGHRVQAGRPVAVGTFRIERVRACQVKYAYVQEAACVWE